jgi:hypothetical protein
MALPDGCPTNTMAKTPRRLLLGFLMLVAGIVAWGAFENLQGRRALRAYKASLLAHGEKLKIEELTPRFSAEAHRTSSDLIQAGWRFRDGPILAKGGVAAMRFVIPGRARVICREPGIGADRATNEWSELAAELEQNSTVLADIRGLLGATKFSFNLNYKEGFNLMLPQLAKAKGISQRLSAATLCDLHSGRLKEAAANLDALIRLPEVFREEPLVISQLVRIAMSAIALGPTWEALQADGWTDEQLAGLQKNWESLEFLHALERAIEMERAMGIEMFERLRRSSAERKQMFSDGIFGAPGGPPAPLAPSTASDVPEYALELGKRTLSSTGSFARETAWLWLWSCHDERRYLEMIQTMLEIPREVRRKGSLTASLSRTRIDSQRLFQSGDLGSPKYFLALQLAPALEKASLKAARLETQREMAVAAIALMRYQLRHHESARALAALVPEFLSSVPRDFMDGKELRYRTNADGTFLLYSVNEDGKDDGGDPRPVSPTSSNFYFGNGRDMVWPMPATAADIAEADAREAKKSGAVLPTRQMMERYGLVPTNATPKP